MSLSRMSPLLVFLVEGKHTLLPLSSQAMCDFLSPRCMGKGHRPLLLPTAGRLRALQAAALAQAWKAPGWFNLLFTAPWQGDTFSPEPPQLCFMMERGRKEPGQFGYRAVQTRTRRAECLLMIKKKRQYINSFSPYFFFS